MGINAIGCYIQTWQSRARAAHTTRGLQINSEATNRDGQENPRTPVPVLRMYHPQYFVTCPRLAGNKIALGLETMRS